MQAPLILALDTTAAHSAAALFSGPACLAFAEGPAEGGAGTRLLPLVHQVLAAAGRDLAALDALAVGTGPGPFTGLRLAVSLARGLALGLGRPAFGVTLFEALAEGQPRPLTLALEAGREGAFVQSFGTEGPEGPATLCPLSALPAGAPPPLRPDDLPAARRLSGIALVAARRLSAPLPIGGWPRPAPFYLRPADAAPPSAPPLVILA